MSFEALSRGAESAVLIESSREAKRSILQNIDALSLRDQTRLIFGDVLKYLSKMEGAETFDIIYADPPYSQGIGEKLLHALDQSSLLAKEGLLFIEEGTDINPESLETLNLLDIRTYGLTKLHRFQRLSRADG